MMAAGSVLLLEDEPMIREVLELVLADSGHSVRVCDSPDQVCAAAAETPGALAVVDFWGRSHQTLHDDERAEVVRLAQAVPTILVTGRTWATDEVAQELGALAVVPKPFDVDNLSDLVASSLTQIHAGGAAV